ncbi:MAG: TetR/AcrR family transcriptional regulator [Deltaproteobacteria bacterium]|nr:TetR/AcrR family transcriptional regulator [Deltaproteobacteria bacterium]
MAIPGRINLKEEKARATRRRILVAATELFARQGFHKTTVVDIGAAIGMTQGAVFHHFATKEALLLAVVERLSRGLEAYKACLTHPEAGFGPTVRRLVDLMVDHFHREPEATICLATLATEFAGSEDPVVGRIKAAYDGFADAFEAALRGNPNVKDPRAAGIAFIGAVQGIAVQGLLRENDAEARIDQLAEAFLGMLSPW